MHSQARDAFDEANAELLEVLASQAAIAVTNARLYEKLGEESAALARQTDSQRRLLQINQRLLSTLEPASVLELIADGLKNVVRYDSLGVYRVAADEGVLTPVLARDRDAEAVLGFPIPRGQGLTWWCVEHREPVLLNDALSDERLIQIPGTPVEEQAIIIVPLISGDEVIGAMNIGRTGGSEVAFTDADFELVQLFAAQAAVGITNARLYEELRERADAQRSLAEIAAQIASLHDPLTVIQRAVADAARLLRADRAQVNLAAEGGTHLERPIAAAPIQPSPDDVIVPIGSGIAGMAAAERRVRWTGDYLSDEDFPHDEGDARIAAQDIHSMMSAPLLGPGSAARHDHRPDDRGQRLRRRRRRAAEAPRRPGRHRAHERAPVRRGRGVRAPLPPPHRQLARHRVERRCRGPLHVLQRLARGADRLEAGAAARPAVHACIAGEETLAAAVTALGDACAGIPTASSAFGWTCPCRTGASARPRSP